MTPGYILISHPDGRQQAIPLRAGLLRIGSAPDNDLVLAGAGIAARHATIRCDDRGRLADHNRWARYAQQRGGRWRSSCRAPSRRPCWCGSAATRCATSRPRGLSYNSLQAAAPPDDQATLLHALLDQRIVWADAQPGRAEPHEAITIEMQALRGVGVGE